jgi:hypothetical protein
MLNLKIKSRYEAITPLLIMLASISLLPREKVPEGRMRQRGWGEVKK